MEMRKYEITGDRSPKEILLIVLVKFQSLSENENQLLPIEEEEETVMSKALYACANFKCLT